VVLAWLWRPVEWSIAGLALVVLCKLGRVSTPNLHLWCLERSAMPHSGRDPEHPALHLQSEFISEIFRSLLSGLISSRKMRKNTA